MEATLMGTGKLKRVELRRAEISKGLSNWAMVLSWNGDGEEAITTEIQCHDF